MKTLQSILDSYTSQALDGRDIVRLAKFVPEEDFSKLGMELKPEFVGTHEAIPFTRENVLKQLAEDVDFGFEKALNQRGISSSLMAEVVQMWNWILEEGLEDFDEYPMYGLPIFKATALKYGFPNPIGDDTGSEESYNE